MIWFLKTQPFANRIPPKGAEKHREHRIRAILYFLRKEGPLSSADLGRRLCQPTSRIHQWMIAEAARSNRWVRMPNHKWLLTDEEPVEQIFDDAD